MTDRKTAIVVLAAGMGTRMKSDRPKVLHDLAGRSMLAHVLAEAEALAPERISVVVGPGMEAVAAAAAPHAVAVQSKQQGTGDAVNAARSDFEDWLGSGEAFDLLVIFGDTPLLRAETLSRLAARRREPDAPSLVGMAFRPGDPARYGRILLNAKGQVERIVEFADCSEDQKEIGLCNGGMLLADGAKLFDWLGRLTNDNAQGEYYLTDVYELASEDGEPAALVEAPEEEVQGINDRLELARAEAVIQQRLREDAMARGVTFLDPSSAWLSWDTKLAQDVVVQPSVYFGSDVVVETAAEIRAFSHLEGVRIGPGAVVGPFARLRPGTVLDERARVGNFVEVKNARLGEGAKANHLTYLGDSTVGAGANVGAGTITCNYDGFAKHRTEIGAGAFIGSNSALVAPVSVGKGAIIGAGSTITRDVEDDALAVARGDQHVVQGGAKLYRAKRNPTQ